MSIGSIDFTARFAGRADMLSGALIGVIVLAIVFLGLIWMSMAVVPEGMHYTVEMLGRFRRVLTPGRKFLLPFVERIAARVDMQPSLLVLPPQSVVTADGHRVTLHANLQWQVHDAARAVYQVLDHRQALAALAAEKLRQLATALAVAELRSHPKKLAERLRADIEQESAHWGIAVLQLDIADIATEGGG